MVEAKVSHCEVEVEVLGLVPALRTIMSGWTTCDML